MKKALEEIEGQIDQAHKANAVFSGPSDLVMSNLGRLFDDFLFYKMPGVITLGYPTQYKQTRRFESLLRA